MNTKPFVLCIMCVLAAVAIAPAQVSEIVLHGFRDMDGKGPEGGVTLAPDGSLYGTTAGGGMAGNGVVYKWDATSDYSVLYNFTGGTDGASPEAGVALDSTGNLYGTTMSGGTYSAGTLYKLDATGHETVLYSFGFPGNYGKLPIAGVTLDPAGNLYGTVNTDNIGTPQDQGAVYKLDAAGHYTVLHRFTGGADGGNPEVAGVIRDSAGNLYGTTCGGGLLGFGVVYELDIAGRYTVLYQFRGGVDGACPYAGVTRDSAGNLYGTAAGGAHLSACGNEGCGVVYKVDASRQYTVLHRFTGRNDGAFPEAGVICDSAGNLFGITAGGLGREGPMHVAYKLDATGKFTVLHQFTDSSTGRGPSRLTGGSNGRLFGTGGEILFMLTGKQ